MHEIFEGVEVDMKDWSSESKGLKQRDEVLDNRAKHNVQWRELKWTDSVREHMSNCRANRTTSA